MVEVFASVGTRPSKLMTEKDFRDKLHVIVCTSPALRGKALSWEIIPPCV